MPITHRDAQAPKIKTESGDTTSGTDIKDEKGGEETSAIDLYYAELAREQSKQERDLDTPSASGDLSDEFEDVDGLGGSPQSAADQGQLPTIKLESPAGTITPGSSFATTPGEDSRDPERSRKRVKLESDHVSINGKKNLTTNDSDSEAEFEDV